MVNKLTSNKRSALLCLLLLVTLTASAEQVTKQTPEQTRQASTSLPALIYETSEHFSDINSANLDGLLKRIGDSRLVLLGEATHGTAEFYDMRARITRELIEKKGFNIVALEADWPDATSIDFFIRGSGKKPNFKSKPFSDFPSWMWANQSVLAFTHWLKDYNQRFNSAEEAVGLYGLDIYNMYGSIEAVLDYLQDIDAEAAEAARWSYACLMPWVKEPSLYSRDMQAGRYRGCEYEVFAVLQDLHKKRAYYKPLDKQRYFTAVQNARLLRNGEHFFRTMYNNHNNSWNQRDQNMFETLQVVLNYRGQTSKAVVWAHNSHIGDARATPASTHGQINLGQLAREKYGESAYLIGFGTDHGTVAAASVWGGPMKVMQIPPARKDSYEYLFHQVKTDNFLLPLRNTGITRKELMAERQQRAIGTSYDPQNELKKHYYYVTLPDQFDEYIWFDETQAVKPLSKSKGD